jgi:hypothetical protein
MCIGGFWKPYIEQAVGGAQDMTGGTEECGAIQLVACTWLRKGGGERSKNCLYGGTYLF